MSSCCVTASWQWTTERASSSCALLSQRSSSSSLPLPLAFAFSLAVARCNTHSNQSRLPRPDRLPSPPLPVSRYVTSLTHSYRPLSGGMFDERATAAGGGGACPPHSPARATWWQIIGDALSIAHSWFMGFHCASAHVGLTRYSRRSRGRQPVCLRGLGRHVQVCERMRLGGRWSHARNERYPQQTANYQRQNTDT